MNRPIIHAAVPAPDTGWRDVSTDLTFEATGELHIRQVGAELWWRIRGLQSGTAHRFYLIPYAIRPAFNAGSLLQTLTDTRVQIDSGGGLTRLMSAPRTSTDRWESGRVMLDPGTGLITDPPGVAV